MKAARANFDKLITSALESEKVAMVQKLRGPELASLLSYAEGREPSDAREDVIGMVLLEAATRYLRKVAKKQKRRVRNIL